MKIKFIFVFVLFNFLKIRLIQLKRELISLGWWRVILICLFVILSGWFIYKEMKIFPGCYYITGFIGLITAMIHIYRKDKIFILITGAETLKIYFAEYAFFSIPVLVLMALTIHWYCLFALLCFDFVLSFINYTPQQKNRGGYTFSFIPKDNFEWISGIRKNSWFLSGLYLLALALLKYPYASLFILWIMLAIIASFYKECEPFDIINLSELPPKLFILQKLKLHFKSYFVFSIPILAGYCIFHIQTVWEALIIFVLSLINLSLFILSKYAVYEPKQDLSANNLLVTLIHLCMLVPVIGQFLFPVPLLMSIRAYRKSLHNLNLYLDAYY
ncbi:MAG: hypothetical protein EPN39_06995 [Chitinophagaceae bacterium]|nr:MAG: hypothetical protein EPN39_06995 [Chitinophagaceae bacterium]